MVYGIGRVLLGVWDIGRGLFAWYGPMFHALGMAVGAFYEPVGKGWTTVLQPMVGWLWSVGKPVAEFFGNIIGWVLDKIGTALSWIGKLIGGAAEATDAMMKIPAGPPPAAGPAATTPSAAPHHVVPTDASRPPVFDFRRDFNNAATTLKDVGKNIGQDVWQGAAAGLLRFARE